MKDKWKMISSVVSCHAIDELVKEDIIHKYL